MKEKMTFSLAVGTVLNYTLMIFLVLITLYPFAYIIFASFSDPRLYISNTDILIKPLGFTFVAYEKAFEHPLILSAYMNSVFLLVVGTFISIIFSIDAAYFLSRKNVLFKKYISLMMVFTMYFSGGLIPFYLTVKNIGLYDSRWSLIFPVLINTYNVIVLRTAFDSIPSSMEESAKLDGAGHMTILVKIMAPLAKPTIAVVVLYYGVAYWNSWFNASLFLRDSKLYPLQLVLRQIIISNAVSENTSGMDTATLAAVSETIKYAVIVITTLPILCIYPAVQKYFVKGVMIGAVKE